MAAMFASPQDALTTPARPTCGRVDLINGAGRSVPLNPPEMSAYEPNFAPGVLPRYVRITRDFAAFGPSMRYRLPCRRSRVRAPSAALTKAPLRRGFLWADAAGISRSHSALPLGATTRGYACDTREQATSPMVAASFECRIQPVSDSWMSLIGHTVLCGPPYEPDCPQGDP
jgi:hypothetical protein